MKISKLQGGLGNQMYQYAVARALEKDKSKDILLDFTFLNSHTQSSASFTARTYELFIFSKLRASSLSAFYHNLIFSTQTKYKVLRKLFFFRITTILQSDNEFVKFPDVENIYLDGYFQSEKYFKSIREDLINDFEFPELDKKNKDILSKIGEADNTVSIHIRHGDYLKLTNANQTHGVLSLDYYKQSIQHLIKEHGEDISFFIFTDDPQFVYEEFKFLKHYTLVEGNDDSDSWKDMCLMTACDHHIIANSSFSWWGAWLSHKQGITIAPARWFNKEFVTFDIDDFIPANWIKIDA